MREPYKDFSFREERFAAVFPHWSIPAAQRAFDDWLHYNPEVTNSAARFQGDPIRP